VVVLGARGFIGSALQRRLRAEEFNTLGLASADIDLTHASATDKLASTLNASDAVVMLAALTPDRGRDIATMMKNLAMMQRVCDAIGRTSCSHLVYFSSDAVYPFIAGCVSEETPASPQDLYGAMHLTREAMARSLASVPLLVLRPTLVHGAGDTHNAYGPNRFRRSAEKDGRIQLFGEGEETRDHIHVDDVAAITLRCLERRSTGTLNLATGTSRTFREVAELVARRYSRPVQIVSAPRAGPVSHRHFDIANLLRAFPDARFAGIEHG
jgi:nucleoside-diphosphate-sugar epimerase